MKTLIAAGADVSARTRFLPAGVGCIPGRCRGWFTGQTPFLRAALAVDTATMRLLVAHGADPKLPTLAGTTPLMAAAGVNWAVAQTYTESKTAELQAVALCLELGADVNATNSMGLTALIGAANRGSNDIIKFLVEHGARLNVKDREGRTPIRWAEGVFLAAVGAERKPQRLRCNENWRRSSGA
jgi:ankyrin repeat protein